MTSGGFACAAVLLALAACRREPAQAVERSALTVGPETIAALEARIRQDGDAALDELVRLVIASPADLPAGELDRLGQLLLARSDGAALLERLREQAVAPTRSAELQAWVARLEAYERSILRGVDLNGY